LRLSRHILVGLILFIVFTLSAYPAAKAKAAGQQPLKVFVDTKQIAFQVDPLLIDGTTLVQFRPLFEAMGMTVKWDEAERLVTGSKPQLKIELRIDEPQATVNGNKVELSQSARIVDGSTMVPLRFIGEATGAIVHWDPVNGEITVVTEQLLKSVGLTKEEMQKRLADYAAKQQTMPPTPPKPAQPTEEPKPNAPAAADKPDKPASKPVDLEALQGMYYGLRDDFGGYECGGACWDLYTFLPDNHILVGPPPKGGPETIDCARDKCSTYTIADGKLKLSDGKSYDIKSKDGSMYINDVIMTPVEPVTDGLTLKGTYKYIGYSGLVGINAASSSWTEYLTFASDGTFKSTDLNLASLNVVVSSTNSSSSKSDAGTYAIKGNTITLKYKDGTTVNSLFFDHSPGKSDSLKKVQIGENRFYIPKD